MATPAPSRFTPFAATLVFAGGLSLGLAPGCTTTDHGTPNSPSNEPATAFAAAEPDAQLSAKPNQSRSRTRSRLARGRAGARVPSRPSYDFGPVASDEPNESTDAQAGARSDNADQPTDGANATTAQFISQPAESPQRSDRADNRAARAAPGVGLFGSLPQSSAATGSMDGQDNVRRITFTSEGSDFDVVADHAGERLVFASTRHRATSDIYVKRVGGTAVTQLTNDPADDVMPTLSPDGQTIAFASNRSGNWDIYRMPIDGGPAERITDDPTHDIHPSFSPDGSRLVYSSYGSASGQWELVLIDLASTGTRKILGHGLFPQFSPTGEKIVFQRARQRGTHWFSVWTVDLEGGEAVRPTELVASRNAAAITPSWSPDGSHIVFCTVVDPGADNGSTVARPSQADVWIMRADGSGRSRLTSGQFANLQPTWAGDGSIFFVSDRAMDGIENLWMVRPERAVKLADRGRPDPRLENVSTAEAPTN